MQLARLHGGVKHDAGPLQNVRFNLLQIGRERVCAGLAYLVGNGQHAPLKIDIRPRQSGQFFSTRTGQNQGTQVHAGGAVVQLLYALPPTGQLGGFNLVGALCVARQVFENRRRFEGIPDGDPSNVKSNTCLCPLENGRILDRP